MVMNSSNSRSLHKHRACILCLAFVCPLLCASSDGLVQCDSSVEGSSCSPANKDIIEAVAADSYEDATLLHLLQKSATLHSNADAVHKLVHDEAGYQGKKDVARSSGPSGALHHIYHMGYKIKASVEETIVCSMISSNTNMTIVAIIVPCVMIVVFAILSAVAQRVWKAPPVADRGANQPKVTRVNEDGTAAHINWHFVPWSSTAIAMANVNYVVVLPAAVENFSGSFLEAGVWVGLYACGALIALPFFVSLGHHWSRTALASHAIFTIIGNVIMVWASYKQYLAWLYIGRIITGFAGSYKYSCDHGCLHLIPTWDRLEAIFITRMAYAVGFALGPCISPICDWILLGCPVLLHIFPTYNSAAEAVPLVIMTAYGILFLFLSLFVLTSFEILDPQAEGVSDISHEAVNAANVTSERKWTAIRIFISTNVTNFTRIFIRVAWEAGALVTLVHQYCLATVAGLVLSLTAITLVVSRNAMSKLSIAVGGDNAKLMRVFEWTGIISCPFLFRATAATEFALALFLIGSIIFYNSNSAQSGVLLALGGEVAIPGHRWLNKKALNIYYFVSNITAYIFGPITSFVTQELAVGQNTVACLVAIVTIIQIFITYTTVRPKAEINVALDAGKEKK